MLIGLRRACGQGPQSICDLLLHGMDYQGKTVSVTGSLIASEAVFIAPYNCEVKVESGGRIWPALIALRGSERGLSLRRSDPLSITQLRKHGPEDDVVVTVEGRFETVQANPSLPGFGHLNEAPAELIGWNIKSAQRIKSSSLSVCDVLRNRHNLSRKTLSVRGELCDTESGAYLRAHDCTIDINTPGRAWPPAIWLAFPRTKRAVGALSGLVSPAPSQSPWECTSDPAKIWTVTGQFRTPGDEALRSEGGGYGERAQYIGEVIVVLITNPEEISRSKLLHLRRR